MLNLQTGFFHARSLEMAESKPITPLQLNASEHVTLSDVSFTLVVASSKCGLYGKHPYSK